MRQGKEEQGRRRRERHDTIYKRNEREREREGEKCQIIEKG